LKPQGSGDRTLKTAGAAASFGCSAIIVKKRLKKRDVFLLVSIIIWIALIAAAIGTFFKINTGARRELREAKDVLIAMKIVAVEKYGSGSGMIYDFEKQSGLSEAVLKKVHLLSETEGEITVTSWDTTNNEPKRFTYESDNYKVYYVKENGKVDWKVSYELRVMNFSKDN